jgi:hypothetical protein
MFKAALAAAMIAGTALAAPANATVLVQFFDGDTAQNQGLTYLINNFEVDAGVTGDYVIHPPVTDYLGAVPAHGSTGNYLSVLGENEAYIDLNGMVSQLAFDWGSLDDYNTLTVYGVGGIFDGNGGSITIIPGAPLGSGTNGDQFAALTNGALMLTAQNGEIFTGLKLASEENSFEIDNLYTNAVPELATWALMIGGFALAGLQMRRRQTAVSFA